MSDTEPTWPLYEHLHAENKRLRALADDLAAGVKSAIRVLATYNDPDVAEWIIEAQRLHARYREARK